MPVSSDPHGRFLILVCYIDKVLCTIVNSYAPNSCQIAFLNKLWKKVVKVRQGQLLWVGDFNGICDKELDSSSRGMKPPLQVGSWLSKLQLFDSWRCLHNSERDYTFYSHVHKSFSRIDMLLVDRQSLKLINKCEIGGVAWQAH